MKGYFCTGYADKEQNWSVWMRGTRLQSENTSVIYQNGESQVECNGVEPNTIFVKGQVPEWLIEKLSRQWGRKTGNTITARKIWKTPELQVGLYVQYMTPEAIANNLMWSSFARHETIQKIEENGVRFASYKGLVPFENVRVSPNYY